MKIAIIAIAKNENNYINEWVSWHLNLGFDNIILCDNNDSCSESLCDVVHDSRVIIKDYRNVDCVQTKAYTAEFLNYRNEYTWIAFIDIDEFIFLDTSRYRNIKEFVKIRAEMYTNLDCIRLCWKIYTTNNLDTDNDYRVVDRCVERYKCKYDSFCKSILRTSIEWCDGVINGHGYFKNPNLRAVNSIGDRCDFKGSFIENPSHEFCYIRHYPTKSVGEFVRQKYMRGGPNNRKSKRYNNLEYYFKFNEYTSEKESYAKKVLADMGVFE